MLRKAPLFLIGAGQVGRDFLRIVAENRELHERRYGLSLQVFAIGDSSGYIASKDASIPLPDSAVLEMIAFKEAGKCLRDHKLFAFDSESDLLSRVNSSSIVVDTSAIESGDFLRSLSDAGARIVMANKKPLTATQAVFDALTQPSRLPYLGIESTVAAGTPVIAVLNRLLDAGEKISSIKGTLSGTLGYVTSGLENGHSFSDIVSDAFKRGFTEPDPRDDLGGVDVARKALIMARSIGIKADMSDVNIEALYPAEFAKLPVPEFMARLNELDVAIAEQVETAAKSGQVLRYVAQVEVKDVERASLKVSLCAVDKSSALGQLSGTDNLVEFFTDAYCSSPLVVHGAGAGARVTSIGVLADVVDVALKK